MPYWIVEYYEGHDGERRAALVKAKNRLEARDIVNSDQRRAAISQSTHGPYADFLDLTED